MLEAKQLLRDRAALARHVCGGKVCVEIGVFECRHAKMMLAAKPNSWALRKE